MSELAYEPIPNELRSDVTWKPTPALDAEVAELLMHYPQDQERSASLMVLHAVQEAHGWIPQEASSGRRRS
jgi:NADH:ubiquinone oxidoreductase subunit E